MKRLTLMLALTLCLVAHQNGLAGNAADGDPRTSEAYGEAVYLLETWIESIIEFDRLPGMSLAVVHDQETVYARGFGYLDAANSVPATSQTIYSICSISKLFTAIALMQLRDAGSLSLDDPVFKHLPWVGPALAPTEASPPVLRDLLRHSSGLPCEPDLTIWPDRDSLNPSREGLIARASVVKASHTVNTTFNYSNLGYALLGEIVSTASGMEYRDYVEEQILEPLGLKATKSYMPNDLLGRELAIGYGRWPRHGTRVEIPNRDARALTPAGGFSSTVEDLAKLAMWQFRVLDGTDEDVLSQATLREMQTAHWTDPDWGLGFSIWHVGNKTAVGHQGGCPGYKSQIVLWPEDRIAVVVMINASDAPQFTLAFRTHEIMAPALRGPSAERRERSDWTKYVGYYTADESWSDAEVLAWDGSLAVLWIPAEDPLGSLIRLDRTDGEVFREVKSSGEYGKHYVFEGDSAGTIVSMKFNNNQLSRSVR